MFSESIDSCHARMLHQQQKCLYTQGGVKVYNGILNTCQKGLHNGVHVVFAVLCLRCPHSNDMSNVLRSHLYWVV